MAWYDLTDDEPTALYVRSQIAKRAVLLPAGVPAGSVAEADGNGGITWVPSQMVGQPGYDTGVWS